MIPEFITQFFRAAAEAFGFINKRSDLNNTPEMKKRADAQNEIDQDDSDDKNIANRDLDASRNSLS
jgi:hypothetical protein